MIRNVLCVVGIACAVMCAQPVSAAPVSPESEQTYCGFNDSMPDHHYSVHITENGTVLAKRPSGEPVAWGFTAVAVVQSHRDASAVFTVTLEFPTIRDSAVYTVGNVFQMAGAVFSPVMGGEYGVSVKSGRCNADFISWVYYNCLLPFLAIEMDANTVMAR